MVTVPDYVERGLTYARNVVSGTIPACKWVKLACQRQLDDLERWKDDGSPFVWRPDKGNKVCAFIELLPHIKGEWARRREKIRLEDWQCFVLTVVFGWYNAGGTRRFRTVYIEVPRKNAKSTLSSGVALYMFVADDEAGAEVYSAATTRDQAKIVFNAAQAMARKDKEFRREFGVMIYQHNLNVLDTESKFEPLSADGDTLDGLNVHCGIVDELHAHKNRDVWDVLETATGSREQPILWTITTAGENRAGICYEVRGYVTKVLERLFDDPTFFGVIYTIDQDDDPFSEESWRKANPNFGISVKPDDLQRKAHKASHTPSALANFLTKHLDVWVTSESALFDMQAWDRCADPTLTREQFKGRDNWLGVDLGFVDDIASSVQLFQLDDGFAVFTRNYLPEDTVEESRNSQYGGWVRAGWITATDGNITDVNVIVDDVAKDIAEYNTREVRFDPYNKLVLLKACAEKGVDESILLEYAQSVPLMSPPTERLMQLIKAGKIRHNGDPVLAWALSNVVGHFDAKSNVYPKKERPENKIDPAIALIMTLGAVLGGEDNTVNYTGLRTV
jgi:phage terminase large subunit-like protein